MTRKRWWGIAIAVLGLGALACGETTIFSGETIVAMQLTPEPPPPPTTTPTVELPPPPPASPPRVEVKLGRIQITEKIQFDVNRATIRPESNGLLDEIAQVIAKSATIKKVQVEGHSSADGDARVNLRLSDDRARSVVTSLEKRGVARGVLVAKGFGSSVPLDTGTTEEARERNRRVDFVILDPPTPKASGTGTPKGTGPR